MFRLTLFLLFYWTLFLPVLVIGETIQSHLNEGMISLRSGFPTIAFDDTTEKDELHFEYSYTSQSAVGNQSIQQRILPWGCRGETDGSIVIKEVQVRNLVLQFDVDIVQASIESSVTHFTALNTTHGQVNFCVRVDYEESDGRIHYFHNTQVSIVIDKRAQYSISAVATNSIPETEIETVTGTDYPVRAYFCNDKTNEISPPKFKKAEVVQFCIEVDDSKVSTTGLYVSSVESLTVVQSGSDNSYPIVDGSTDAMTSLNCATAGICIIRTVLFSKYFEAVSPKPLSVIGYAVVSFGNSQRGLSSIRFSQEEPIGSPFALVVSLQADWFSPQNILIGVFSVVLLSLGISVCYRNAKHGHISDEEMVCKEINQDLTENGTKSAWLVHEGLIIPAEGPKYDDRSELDVLERGEHIYAGTSDENSTSGISCVSSNCKFGSLYRNAENPSDLSKERIENIHTNVDFQGHSINSHDNTASDTSTNEDSRNSVSFDRSRCYEPHGISEHVEDVSSSYPGIYQIQLGSIVPCSFDKQDPTNSVSSGRSSNCDPEGIYQGEESDFHTRAYECRSIALEEVYNRRVPDPCGSTDPTSLSAVDCLPSFPLEDTYNSFRTSTRSLENDCLSFSSETTPNMAPLEIRDQKKDSTPILSCFQPSVVHKYLKHRFDTVSIAVEESKSTSSCRSCSTADILELSAEEFVESIRERHQISYDLPRII